VFVVLNITLEVWSCNVYLWWTKSNEQLEEGVTTVAAVSRVKRCMA